MLEMAAVLGLEFEGRRDVRAHDDAPFAVRFRDRIGWRRLGRQLWGRAGYLQAWGCFSWLDSIVVD